MIKDFIVCSIAVLFYSLLMNSPRKSIPFAAILAGIGYVVTDLICLLTGNEVLGFFGGTLIIAVTGEILARILKMPSIIFIFPAIIPLVPGVGLYRTMLLLVQKNYSDAVITGAQTVFIAGAMSVAIALVNIVARYFIPKKK